MLAKRVMKKVESQSAVKKCEAECSAYAFCLRYILSKMASAIAHQGRRHWFYSGTYLKGSKADSMFIMLTVHNSCGVYELQGV